MQPTGCIREILFWTTNSTRKYIPRIPIFQFFFCSLSPINGDMNEAACQRDFDAESCIRSAPLPRQQINPADCNNRSDHREDRDMFLLQVDGEGNDADRDQGKKGRGDAAGQIVQGEKRQGNP